MGAAAGNDDEYWDDWDEWRADADGEGRHPRVRVHLGTWVYPALLFPYFFELGSGVVGLRGREEEVARREREQAEGERGSTECK